MFASRVLFSAFALVFSLGCQAEPTLKTFSFRGHKFGEPLPREAPVPQETPPWIKWGASTISAITPRVTDRVERSPDQLLFGDILLAQLTYRYFDGKLAALRLDFPEAPDCRLMPNVVELLQARYAVHLVDEGPDTATFNNQAVLIQVRCSEPLLSMDTEKPGRVISVRLESVVMHAKYLLHMRDELQQQEQRSAMQRDRELKAKINF